MVSEAVQASGLGGEVWLADASLDPHFEVVPRLPLVTFLGYVALILSALILRYRGELVHLRTQWWSAKLGARGTQALTLFLCLTLAIFAYGYLVALEGHAGTYILLILRDSETQSVPEKIIET